MLQILNNVTSLKKVSEFIQYLSDKFVIRGDV